MWVGGGLGFFNCSWVFFLACDVVYISPTFNINYFLKL